VLDGVPHYCRRAVIHQVKQQLLTPQTTDCESFLRRQ
jgi:hypothetical protein